MVKEDAHLAVAAAHVIEGVLHRGNAASNGAGEVIGAHGKADATLQLHLVHGFLYTQEAQPLPPLMAKPPSSW